MRTRVNRMSSTPLRFICMAVGRMGVCEKEKDGVCCSGKGRKLSETAAANRHSMDTLKRAKNRRSEAASRREKASVFQTWPKRNKTKDSCSFRLVKQFDV